MNELKIIDGKPGEYIAWEETNTGSCIHMTKIATFYDKDIAEEWVYRMNIDCGVCG